MSHSKFNFITIACFAILALIRGSTPLMAYFAVSNLKSAGLVVASKCFISFFLFIGTLIYASTSDRDAKVQIKRNFKDKHVYWKIPLMGLMQTAAPYLLVVYSLQYLPPTLLGVFMAATPWFTIMLERLPFVKIKSTVNSYVKFGIVIGFFGVILVMTPILHETLGNCSLKINKTKSTNSTNQTAPGGHRTYSEFYDICLAPLELVFGMLALVSGSFLWALSTVFWRANRGDIYFSVASIGQNLTAGIIAILCFIAAEQGNVEEKYWLKTKTIVGVVFLGLATGWLATVLVQFLSKKIGPKPTNQVLATLPMIAFIEDCIFVKSVVTVHPWLIALEIIGILLLSVGAFLTNLPESKKSAMNSMLSEHFIDSDSHSEVYHSDYTDIQKEVDKYKILPPASDDDDDDDDSLNEEEIKTNENLESDYPPLREIMGDDFSKTRTLSRKNDKEKLLPEN